ncbi:MAG: hypothetical protein NTY02_14420, partial [Acidobacteria bacterium]|nr:hypothetical protein [Acidobacteriota bacterium]
MCLTGRIRSALFVVRATTACLRRPCLAAQAVAALWLLTAGCAHTPAQFVPSGSTVRPSGGCVASREVLEAVLLDVHVRQRNVGLAAAVGRG